jgi:predicted  nucleic acid-binding Zn-ribbon protein
VKRVLRVVGLLAVVLSLLGLGTAVELQARQVRRIKADLARERVQARLVGSVTTDLQQRFSVLNDSELRAESDIRGLRALTRDTAGTVDLVNLQDQINALGDEVRSAKSCLSSLSSALQFHGSYLPSC